MTQLAFEWPRPASYDPEDFIISGSNTLAVHFLDAWPDGNARAALLSGPTASGKTHLAHRWMKRVGGIMLDKSLLGRLESSEMWGGTVPAVLEDIETVQDETALFHLLRHAETQQTSLLLTANAGAGQLPFCLPDLRSRLRALPAAHIELPDDGLLRICLAKLFADRQLRLSDEVLEYMAKRVERSFASMRGLVDETERASTENKRQITIPLIRKIFER